MKDIGVADSKSIAVENTMLLIGQKAFLEGKEPSLKMMIGS
jgi:hypothetical protein